MLLQDIHYARFVKKMAKSKEKTEEVGEVERESPKSRKSMLYSFNMESMQRGHSD